MARVRCPHCGKWYKDQQLVIPAIPEVYRDGSFGVCTDCGTEPKYDEKYWDKWFHKKYLSDSPHVQITFGEPEEPPGPGTPVYESLAALLTVCQNTDNLWDRWKFLADFYESGRLASVVEQLAPPPPTPTTPACGCGHDAEYLVYEDKQPHCRACMLDALDCDAQVMVNKIL